jgi:hypothetical protein
LFICQVSVLEGGSFDCAVPYTAWESRETRTDWENFPTASNGGAANGSGSTGLADCQSWFLRSADLMSRWHPRKAGSLTKRGVHDVSADLRSPIDGGAAFVT